MYFYAIMQYFYAILYFCSDHEISECIFNNNGIINYIQWGISVLLNLLLIVCFNYFFSPMFFASFSKRAVCHQKYAFDLQRGGKKKQKQAIKKSIINPQIATNKKQ